MGGDELGTEPAAAPHAITIVVADDQVAIRGAIRVLLESQGYRVLEAGSGADVLMHLHSRPVQMVFLDLTMPRMGGIDTLRKIRGTSDWTGLPVVVVSARNTGRDVLEAVQAGANDYVLKPFRKDILLEKAARFAGTPAPPASGAAHGSKDEDLPSETPSGALKKKRKPRKAARGAGSPEASES